MNKLTNTIQVYESSFGDQLTDDQQSALENSTQVAHVKHVYRVAGFSEGAAKYHYCLRQSHWCWSNALSNPLDMIIYLKRKLKRI